MPKKPTIAEMRAHFDAEVKKLSEVEQIAFAQFGLGLGSEISQLPPDQMRPAMVHFLNGAATVLSILKQSQATGGGEITVPILDKAMQTHARLNGMTCQQVVAHAGDIDPDHNPVAGQN